MLHMMQRQPRRRTAGVMKCLPGDKQPQHVSCAAACAAVPGLSPAIDAAPALSGARLIAAPTAALIGFAREGETPPPRITPVI